MPRAKALTKYEDVGELLDRLGGISPKRLRMGQATERPSAHLRGPGRYEVVDRILVAKGESPFRGPLVAELAARLDEFVKRGDLGAVFGPGVWVEVSPGVIRSPDVSFVPSNPRPGGARSGRRSGGRAPHLAVEILTPDNTRKETQIKLKEYFLGGVKLVWLINPDARTAEAYTAPDAVTPVPADGALDGGDVLPGFSLPLAQLFAKFGPPPAKKPARRKKK